MLIRLLPLCIYMQTYFSAIQYGEHVLIAQQDVKTAFKKLSKAKADLQATLNANTTLKGELHIVRGIMERQNTEKKELT